MGKRVTVRATISELQLSTGVINGGQSTHLTDEQYAALTSEEVAAWFSMVVDEADPIPQAAPSAGLSPIPANMAGATTETLTPDPISGSGPVTVVVVPADCTLLAVKIEGDAHPRLVMGVDPTDFGALMLGDGTYDPTLRGATITLNAGNLRLIPPAFDSAAIDLYGPLLGGGRLPTSDPAVSGAYWSNAGVVTISAG